MTEEEKRKLALDFLAAEKRRLATSTFADHRASEERDAHRCIQQRQATLASFAQHGITWHQLKAVYDEAYQRGEQDMLDYHLSFFYAATTIAFHEKFSTAPEETGGFVAGVPDIIDSSASKEALLAQCLAETGVDTRGMDGPPQSKHQLARDVKVIDGLKKKGITAVDLETAREMGYQHGRSKRVHLSMCYAAVAILLSRLHGCGKEEIEQFLDRIAEVADEEISAADILERCKRETGVDVSEMAHA